LKTNFSCMGETGLLTGEKKGSGRGGDGNVPKGSLPAHERAIKVEKSCADLGGIFLARNQKSNGEWNGKS